MKRFKLFTMILVILLMSMLSLSSVKAQHQLIRFGVGPLQPTPAGTKAAFVPFFAGLAKQLDVDYEL